MIITTADAPAAIGPYVQGVNLGAMTITSGQLPINPLDGTMPGDIAEQARQSLENVKAIVEAAGLTVGRLLNYGVCQRPGGFCRHQCRLRGLLYRTPGGLSGALLCGGGKVTERCRRRNRSNRFRPLTPGWRERLQPSPTDFCRSTLFTLQAI